MRDNRFALYSLMVGSFFVAMILTSLPLPHWSVWYRPYWVLIVLIYWVMMMPSKVNVGVAWIVGLLLDDLSNHTLGVHALAFVVIAYMVTSLQRLLRVLPLWQQLFIIAGILMVYQVLILIIQLFVGQYYYNWHYWLPLVSSLVIWPCIQSILTALLQRCVKLTTIRL